MKFELQHYHNNGQEISDYIKNHLLGNKDRNYHALFSSDPPLNYNEKTDIWIESPLDIIKLWITPLKEECSNFTFTLPIELQQYEKYVLITPV